MPDVAVRAESYSLINSVFGNLLTNAVKFSHRGSGLTITATAHDRQVSICVCDHGVGMPPAVLAHLFDVSRSRSQPGTEGERGTGFGMPLLQRLVLNYGGTVEVTSRELANQPADHGTEVKIDLPLADSAAPG